MDNMITDQVDIHQLIRAELDQAQRALDEVNMMLEQSQREVDIITQRNAAINSHLSQVQTQADLIPSADIRAAYTAAMDAQQRLLVMRGRIEKLNGDKVLYDRIVKVLSQLNEAMALENNSGLGDSTSLLDKLTQAQEGERERLSHQMHDGPAQALSNFIIQAEIASRTLDIDAEQAKVELENLKKSATKTFQNIRTFIFELRPMILDDLGLGPTMRRYAASFEEQTGIDVQLMIHGNDEKRLAKTQEIVIFRAIQELMSNAAFHNSDQTVPVEIKVTLELDDDMIEVTVSDNGKGFYYNENEVDESKGFGLNVIRERVEMLNGTMMIETAPTRGCLVNLTIPI
ncbi:MAG: ATP-binding protein [Anaerolineaceae bacterium]|nr:ATP-binding protein [Anaerolineaceae bacterium]